MRQPMLCACLSLLAMLSVAGCNPRTVVTRNPSPDAKGIRYYRPKPYLLITPFTPSITSDGKTLKAEPSDQYVNIEMQWLPDFSEEYAIQVKTGLGQATVNIKLEDGWKLTEINQTLDSNFDDNIKAVAELIKSVAPSGIIPAPRAVGTPDEGHQPTARGVVRATNVPIGYYEAILGQDPCGKKQIYGWRYLGFAPYESCPMAPCGISRTPCDQLDLYGLVFDNGIMMFKHLHAIERIEEKGGYVRCRDVMATDQEAKQSSNPGQPILRPAAIDNAEFPSTEGATRQNAEPVEAPVPDLHQGRRRDPMVR